MTNLGFPACFTPDRDYSHSGYSPLQYSTGKHPWLHPSYTPVDDILIRKNDSAKTSQQIELCPRAKIDF